MEQQMNHSENYRRAVTFSKPEFIPMRFVIHDAYWQHCDQEALKDLMEGHPLLFPDYQRSDALVKPNFLRNARADHPYTDPWGCVWETYEDGVTGAVHHHALESWDNLDNYAMPDPNKTDGVYPVDWLQKAKAVEEFRKQGKLVILGLTHGHTFLKLQDIRGYENLMVDMYDDIPQLYKLISMVEEFNYQYIQKVLELKPDIVIYPEDLGMQVGPMLSPEHFRKFIKPVYQKIIKPAREQGCMIHMHSDGDIRTLVDDLVDGGVQIVNLQDLVNGIDWIADKLAGKVCIDLDIDRQNVTRFGSKKEIDALIRKEVEKLGSPAGGLTMIYELFPDVPLENAKALMDAMEKYADFHS